jgi:hypothetical protein
MLFYGFSGDGLNAADLYVEWERIILDLWSTL